MNIQEQIKNYITSQPETKRSDMHELHSIILQVMWAGHYEFQYFVNSCPLATTSTNF